MPRTFNLIEQELPELLWERIGEQFRAFVGLTAFEDLAHEWVLVQARQGKLGFIPEIVGSHWTKEAQFDVAAVNWRDRILLLGECKWSTDPVRRPVILNLFEKAQKTIPGRDSGKCTVFFLVEPVSPRQPERGSRSDGRLANKP